MIKRIFQSFKTRLWLGTLASTLLPYVLILPWSYNYNGYAYIVSMLAVAFTHFVNAHSIYAITNHPGHKSAFSIIPTAFLCFFCAWIVLKILGLPYSIVYLELGFLVSCIYNYYSFKLRTRTQSTFAYIPIGDAIDAYLLPEIKWLKQVNPQIQLNEKIQGYVADLQSNDLTSEWQNFLAMKTLKGIPVYHIRYVEEMLTGRVKIKHMYENNLGSLLPSSIYMNIKHFLECLLIILSFPITLPVVFITALLIKLEDGGSIIYTQPRVGYRGQTIIVYKLRSMKENNQESATISNDDRITKIGKFIRKTRIDELPQFINVLKGEMSLIGPRAEFKPFADELEKQVPFYNYRHIVKPGISGWAQVMHGYATGAEETQIKLEHDFYYIKHFSFSLDVIIFFKTIKTMLTGFGAR